MTTLRAAVAAAVPRLVSDLYGERLSNPEYLRDAIESVDRDELISTLAGTDDKSSREYKSQPSLTACEPSLAQLDNP